MWKAGVHLEISVPVCQSFGSSVLISPSARSWDIITLDCLIFLLHYTLLWRSRSHAAFRENHSARSIFIIVWIVSICERSQPWHSPSPCKDVCQLFLYICHFTTHMKDYLENETSWSLVKYYYCLSESFSQGHNGLCWIYSWRSQAKWLAVKVKSCWKWDVSIWSQVELFFFNDGVWPSSEVQIIFIMQITSRLTVCLKWLWVNDYHLLLTLTLHCYWHKVRQIGSNIFLSIWMVKIK